MSSAAEQTEMRMFTLDKGFMKGEGVVFRNGQVCIQWQGEIKSIVIYESIEDVKKLHKETIVFAR